jgi:hypothetical protein
MQKREKVRKKREKDTSQKKTIWDKRSKRTEDTVKQEKM